jgi:hypothetical protein
MRAVCIPSTGEWFYFSAIFRKMGSLFRKKRGALKQNMSLRAKRGNLPMSCDRLPRFARNDVFFIATHPKGEWKCFSKKNSVFKN